MRLLCALVVLAAVGVSGQPGPDEEAVSGQFEHRAIERPRALPAEKPNELVRGRVTFSGAAIHVFKTDNPLQLINPLAPAHYGSAEDNVSVDPLSGKASGVNLFAIRF